MRYTSTADAAVTAFMHGMPHTIDFDTKYHMLLPTNRTYHVNIHSTARSTTSSAGSASAPAPAASGSSSHNPYPAYLPRP